MDPSGVIFLLVLGIAVVAALAAVIRISSVDTPADAAAGLGDDLGGPNGSQ
jgi:hypothetical protein